MSYFMHFKTVFGRDVQGLHFIVSGVYGIQKLKTLLFTLSLNFILTE